MFGESVSTEVDFQRDIRPILSDACFQCHGPDAEQRQADLRLDTQAGAFSDLGGYFALVPGDLEQSHLYLRLTASDADQRMPPADHPRQLSPIETELIRRWIETGANWNELWSWVPPQRAALPVVPEAGRCNNSIDRFIQARLWSAGLRPSETANKETLIRRVTLDLTGLLPSIDNVDAFLEDSSPASFERVVDRLLASPRYGERMASQWLNAARYADTSGYQMDGPRQMWRWRDWVIDAFNGGMPFDQFTVEQLAGDLLPDPTLDQLIATGFNRNHRGNAEGGIIPEEYRVEYVVDRVDTTATVWLGLTMGCARCHDHKYDPIAQREFYQLFAFFNNVPERGKARKWGNAIPHIKAPTRAEADDLNRLDRKILQTEQQISELQPEVDQAQAEWESEFASPAENAGSDEYTMLVGDAVLHARLDESSPRDAANAGSTMGRWEGGPAFSAGRIGQAGDFDGTRFVEFGDVAVFDYSDAFSIGAWVFPRGRLGGAIASKMESDTDEQKGYSLEWVDGHFHVNIIRRWLDDCLRVRSRASFPADQWHHVLMTYDGSKVAAGIRIYVNGKLQDLNILIDDFQQPIVVPDPFRIGSRGTHERFHGRIDDVRVYALALDNNDARLLATSEFVGKLSEIPAEKRTEDEAFKLRKYFIGFHASQEISDAYHDLAALRRQRRLLLDQISTVMIMREMETPRETFVLKRGQYDQPGQRVQPGVPASLPPLPEGAPGNRLGLAKWLMDSSNPLTSRVAVNRTWQMFFGDGMVRTAEDFGSQGEKPSYPDVMDWLAVELQTNGWNMKRLQRFMLASASYQQSSKVTPELLRLDPDNRWLARGPRYRLSAEMIRDVALATSELLVERLGGPSVKPYQPPGLWIELTLEEARYVQDQGADLYRRSLYTYWKRTVAPPGMLVLDAPQRETCSVRVARTNTPLQALTLMNDVTYVEAARAFAERVLLQGGEDDASRLEYAFRLLTSRRPTDTERAVLRSALDFHREQFRGGDEHAQLLIAFGESRSSHSLDAAELAAHTAVMNTLLNLDETVTRE